MHRRLQFGMRENPASDRRHGSRLVLQKDSLPDTSRHSSRQQKMLVASDDTEVESATAKGFATGEGGEGVGASTTLASSTRACSDTQIRADVNHKTDQQLQRIVNDAEFEPLLDVVEAARLLRIHPKTLRVKAGHGIIPGIQIGRVWRFRASTLNRWLEGIAGHGRR
jgi:excisionase family DNA binding protein